MSTPFHRVLRTLHETAIYPEHKPRTESDLYRENHHQMVVVEGQNCAVCHTKDKLETHHVHCEWAYANAVDWAKMKELHPNFPDWDKVDPEDPNTFYNFIDSRYNLLVLCEGHHRGAFGIHSVSEPIFFAQQFITEEFLEDEEKN